MSKNLKLSGVRKGFANFLLGAIDLELEEGKVLALIGPNGAGKTTTMDCISGILQPDKGEIEICGIKASPKTKDWKYNFGYVMSEPVFINSMTGSEFLKFVSKYYPAWNFELMNQLLETLEFNPNEVIGKLSTGNKTKLEIISAMSINPKLLLLDEPTNNLDPIIRDRFIELMFDFMLDESHSVLWSTHIITEVSNVADDFAFLNNGKIYEVSSKTDLTENWRRLIVKSNLEFQDVPHVVEMNRTTNEYEMFTSNFKGTIDFLKEYDVEILNDYYMSIETICIKNLQKYKLENL
jgi:ABC-2 type transport system ATP-binding protein